MGGGVVHVHVEVGEPTVEKLPGGSHCVEAAVTGMKGHEPSIGLFGVAVHVDGSFEDVDGEVGVAGALVEFGQTEVGVESPAVEVLANRLDPGVSDTGEKIATVGLDGLA